MSNKKAPKEIDAAIFTKSMAQLEKEISEILKQELEDKDLSSLMASGQAFAGYSPPHTIHGIPYDQLEQPEDENS